MIGACLFFGFAANRGYVFGKEKKAMKKKLKVLCGALCLTLLLTACGGTGTQTPSETPAPAETQTPSETPAPKPADTVPEAESPAVIEGEYTIAGGNEADALDGTVFGPGTVLNAVDCAIMLSYELEADDGGAAEEKLNSWAEANGCVPVTQSGEGLHVYAIMGYDDMIGAVVLGEEDSFRIGVEAGEQGQTRRFAQKNILWTAEDVTGWEVSYVVRQDYYEEDGEQYPCFTMGLVPVE